LAKLFAGSPGAIDKILAEIRGHTKFRETIPASIGLPLSDESKRILLYASEEADALAHKNIGTEHLLLGILRDQNCCAAQWLGEKGVALKSARAQFFDQDENADEEQVKWLEDRPPFQRFMKRAMDIVGSIVAIVFFSPLLLVTAAAIKLTSRGPILFRQARRGYHGQEFVSLKFRSMYMNEPSIQKEYVEQLVSGKYGEMGEAGVYKLRNYPRFTRVGTFLRRTALDELPQFFSVLLGRMSLVGPRPPLSYEWDACEPRHKKRLSCKPGITGLSQVNGRSRVTFDQMVELDMKYATTQTFWLDLKILLRTPVDVIGRVGAY
jgi:lipopolysaccharide/colanic/teichoic acid biosynthesis glycosyltransferase